MACEIEVSCPTHQPSDNKITGRIIKISRAGWGFISSKEIQFTRIFFHWTAIRQNSLPFLELKIGMMVEFTPLQIPEKGWRAIHVRTIDEERQSETPVPPLHEQGQEHDGGGDA